ncbi:OmpA family protein [Candidatus Palauibacter sp.]|uniref:OmpA family protein n=1 Tax=Candidatus Palauibacter sp. TaxID=3101350 RepID=UPI003B527CDA
MRLSHRFAPMLLVALLATACSGNPEPEPVPPPPPPPPPPVVDDSAQREAAASRLCDQAMAAMEEGDFATARRLLEQAVSDYPGTTCAESAHADIERAMDGEAIVARIHFDYNESEITDASATILQSKADALRDRPGIRLRVEGHCDERGSLEYNQALGLERAQAAVDYLSSLGLDADRFDVVTFGEEMPLARGSNESAWRQNRRGEFVITDGDI